MKFKYSIKTAYKGLRTNKSRSLLTILGIVIGVGSIIIITALGSGAQNLILGEINSLGADTAVLQPGSGEGFDPAEALLAKSITEADYDAIQKPQNVPNLRAAMPVVAVSGSVSYRGETYRPMIMGGDADFFIDAFDVYPDEGVPFQSADIDANARVAIIGKEVKDELFGSISPIGEMITIKNQRFRVVAVFPAKGQVAFIDIDNLVMVPYTSAQAYLSGDDYLTEIVMKADSSENINKLVYDVESTIRETHGIEPGEEDDFAVRTQQALIDQISTVITILTSFLAAMVAVSLVVGGIGIMNIMLVSVTERTKEIGLRKALGATRSDIQLQFILEAVMLTGIGGIIGVFSGAFIARMASFALSTYVVSGWVFVFPVSGALIGFVVSAFIGLLFGIYPARKAADKSPIEALRYE
jgi:putative ABC transport system permease protein